MNSDKQGAKHLTAVLKAKGVKQVVVCPGSRNAPLIISFTSDPFFKCYSIVDERSAGFFALGLSQVEKNTVALVCTSGTALLNIAPAVAEAYYQRLPLLVISADRPKEWVNQGESQTMNQDDVFHNYVRASYDLVQEPESEDDLWFHDRQVSKAIEQTLKPYYGPAHLNIRFKEPLYGKSKENVIIRKSTSAIEMSPRLNEREISALRDKWNGTERIMIICGQMFPEKALNNLLDKLALNGIVILTESTSNMPGKNFFPCIDKIIMPANEEEIQRLKPDLLITIGGPLVSRKIKSILRPDSNMEHWHVDPIDPNVDAFKHLTKAAKMNPLDFLNKFTGEKKKDTSFCTCWKDRDEFTDDKHNEFLSKAPFSDLKSFDSILEKIPAGSMLQVGNSSSIRYVQLMNEARELINFSNRGTSGIEGSVSTALGASVNFNGLTFLVTGDLSMLYDSNALWNNYLSPKFKIVVINNGGGGIFRIIEGPKTISNFEKYIETKHDKDFGKLANLYDLSFFRVDDLSGLNEVWDDFVNEDKKASLLEIKTTAIENEKVLKQYFDHLKSNA